MLLVDLRASHRLPSNSFQIPPESGTGPPMDSGDSDGFHGVWWTSARATGCFLIRAKFHRNLARGTRWICWFPVDLRTRHRSPCEVIPSSSEFWQGGLMDLADSDGFRGFWRTPVRAMGCLLNSRQNSDKFCHGTSCRFG